MEPRPAIVSLSEPLMTLLLGSIAIGLSSASSAISAKLRWRKELLDDLMEAEAVCSEHADDNALSRRSDGEEKEYTVS